MRHRREVCPTCNRPMPKPRRKRSDPTPLELLGRAITQFAGFTGEWSPLKLSDVSEPFASWGNLPGVEWRRRYEAWISTVAMSQLFAAVSTVAKLTTESEAA